MQGRGSFAWRPDLGRRFFYRRLRQVGEGPRRADHSSCRIPCPAPTARPRPASARLCRIKGFKGSRLTASTVCRSLLEPSNLSYAPATAGETRYSCSTINPRGLNLLLLLWQPNVFNCAAGCSLGTAEIKYHDRIILHQTHTSADRVVNTQANIPN